MIAVLEDKRTIFGHIGPWTERDYLALEPGGSRIELLDGSLLVRPAPSLSHQRVCMRLAHRLDTCAPDGAEALEGVNLRVAPGRLLIPDVLVTFEQPDDLVCDARLVLLAAEVVSPSNRGALWQEKRELYAAARVPWYLVVDIDNAGDLNLELLRLEGGRYASQAKVARGEQLEISGFTGSLDPADLLKRPS